MTVHHVHVCSLTENDFVDRSFVLAFCNSEMQKNLKLSIAISFRSTGKKVSRPAIFHPASWGGERVGILAWVLRLGTARSDALDLSPSHGLMRP